MRALPPIWTTEDGAQVSIHKMSNQHILQTLRQLNQEKIDALVLRREPSDINKEWLSRFTHEAEVRRILIFL